MGAGMQVWLRDERWYADPAVRAVYESLTQVLDRELQREGCRVEAQRGSGHFILDIGPIPDGAWDKALHVVLAELQKGELLDHRNVTVRVYRVEANDKPEEFEPYKFRQLWPPPRETESSA